MTAQVFVMTERVLIKAGRVSIMVEQIIWSVKVGWGLSILNKVSFNEIFNLTSRRSLHSRFSLVKKCIPMNKNASSVNNAKDRLSTWNQMTTKNFALNVVMTMLTLIPNKQRFCIRCTSMASDFCQVFLCLPNVNLVLRSLLVSMDVIPIVRLLLKRL